MNRYKKRRVERAREHQKVTRERKKEALAEAKEKAKTQKKGQKGEVAEMEKSGYVPTADGGFRRLQERSLLKAQRRNEKSKPQKQADG